MKNSLWLTSILLLVLAIPSNFSQIGLGDGSGITTTRLAILQGKREWVQRVPAAQVATPGPTGTLEPAYPIEPGTSPLGLIIGAVVYASLMRRRN
jgi:hypothetical protein